MEELKQHEQFEIAVLKLFSSAGLLSHLVFGGGTCLRLCFGLSRYSVDLDFWSGASFTLSDFKKMKRVLSEQYDITDSQSKFFSYLLEIRSPAYPKRLKIEIRKENGRPETQLSIAYSFFSNVQIQLTTFTLHQMWKNKVAALLERGEIRDAYDLEFIYKKGGADLKSLFDQERTSLISSLRSFSFRDLKVKLGSLLGPEERRYYNERGFAVLENALK